jgi:hypothetical protein
MTGVRSDVPDVLAAAPGVDDHIFIDWGNAMCDILRDGGAYAMLGSVTAYGAYPGSDEERAALIRQDVLVTQVASTTLCPDQAEAYAEFIELLQRSAG